MSELNNALQTPSNLLEKQVEFPTPAMNKPSEEHQEISPEIAAWLDRVVAAHNKIGVNQEYREEVTKKVW